jgi:hypothetical protein
MTTKNKALGRLLTIIAELKIKSEKRLRQNMPWSRMVHGVTMSRVLDLGGGFGNSRSVNIQISSAVCCVGWQTVTDNRNREKLIDK